jgi:RNase P subunit RPR2
MGRGEDVPFLEWGRRPVRSVMRCRWRWVMPRDERTSTRCLYGGLTTSTAVSSAPSRFRLRSFVRDVGAMLSVSVGWDGEQRERVEKKLGGEVETVGTLEHDHPPLDTSARQAMAKKAREVPKEPSSGAVPSRDVLQRLSYLYQASTFLSTSLSRSTAPVAAPVTDSVNRLIPTQVGQEDVKGKGREDDMDVDLATGAVEGPQEEGVKEKSKKEKKKRPKKSKSKAEGDEDKLPRATTSALPTVSRMMVGTMRDVAKKGTLRMCVPSRCRSRTLLMMSRDPSVKRTMCKGCCAVLIPGVNCRVRIKRTSPPIPP